MQDHILEGHAEERSTHATLEERFGAPRPPVSETAPAASENKERAAEIASPERPTTYDEVLSSVRTRPTASQVDVARDVDVLRAGMDRESQITHLIDLAMTKGVEYAVNVARKTDDFYVLDQLHDRLLSDELHDALVARGLVEL